MPKNGRGTLPPNAIDLEEAVLSAVINFKDSIYQVAELLKPECFYKLQHQVIFEVCLDLFNKNKPIDLLTVSNELKRIGKLDEIGGDYAIINLTKKVSGTAHLQYHCLVIIEKYVKRKSIEISANIIDNSHRDDMDVFELLETIYREFGAVSDSINIKKSKNFKEAVNDFFSEKNSHRGGYPSVISKINHILNGYQKTDLIILAARPGMGKTALALNELLESALKGIPVAFFSMEMSIKQVVARFLSIVSGIGIQQILSNNLSESEMNYLKECSKMLSGLPIFIDDTPALSPVELKIKLSKLQKENGIQIAFVDYLQLMRIKDKKNNREQEISEISGSLKAIAKEMDIPMVALSQLSRSVETRGGSKRPLLSDLRDSGAIEQDADVVMFIYRPEYYKIKYWDDEDGKLTANQADIEIAKHRNGETKLIRVGCMLKYMRFMDLEKLHEDLTRKYFKGKEPENKPEFLPAMQPEEAFNDDMPF